MKLHRLALSVVLAGILVLSAPLSANAAEATFFGPIVPDECRCDSQTIEGTNTKIATAPDYGCALQVLQNVINFAITIAIILFVLYTVVTGFAFITGSNSAEGRNKAKTRFMNVIVGLVVLLVSWLIVDYIMKTLYDGSKFGPWNAILAGDAGGNDRCIVAKNSKGILSGTIDIITGGSVPSGGGGIDQPIAGTAGCPNCVKLEGFSCKTNRSCSIDSQVLPRLVTLKNTFKGNWVVTEAYPPTVTHKNVCHKNGTCIDAGFTGSTAYNAANIQAFSSAASKAGLRIVFETVSCSLKQQAQDAGVKAYCKTDNGYEHITGNHFSVYSN